MRELSKRVVGVKQTRRAIQEAGPSGSTWPRTPTP